MPRRLRMTLPGQAHHVIQRGNNRQPIFFDDRDRRVFLKRLGDALAAEGCWLHAYVLMTNHVHLLLTPATAEGIPRLMQGVGRNYVAYVNRTHGRTGTLWEGRYKATVVAGEGYVMACYRYIEANPVRAGMVRDAAEYPWSSHGRNALGRPGGLVTDHEIYRALGSTDETRREAYAERFAERMDDTLLSRVRDSVQRGWALGDDRFRAEVAMALGRGVDAPVRGRPLGAKKAKKGSE